MLKMLVETPKEQFILKNKLQMQYNIKMNLKGIASIWTEYISIRFGISSGSREHGNETSSFA
jgi:hypothetical protein